MRDAISGVSVKMALDMGTGSGIIARELAKNCQKVVAVDLFPTEIEGVKTKVSDLFEKIKGEFDLITWNPPYLPGDTYSDLDCGNGEIIMRFFREAKNHLTGNGKIMVVLSSLSPVGEADIEKLGYKTDVVARKKVAFEELRVVRAHQSE